MRDIFLTFLLIVATVLVVGWGWAVWKIVGVQDAAEDAGQKPPRFGCAVLISAMVISWVDDKIISIVARAAGVHL